MTTHPRPSLSAPPSLARLACAALSLAACGGGRDAGDQPRADSSPASSPAPSSGSLVVTPGGVGPVRVGMTLAEASGALGGRLGAAASSECSYVPLDSTRRRDVSLMVVQGRVVRVDVLDSSVVATDAGVRVGDPARRVDSLYAGRVRAEPHKYTNGQYLVVTPAAPADSALRLVFETDTAGPNARVLRYRAGRLPEVQWVEGCA